jgi:DNA invertase Pin-like site-specific DNA recombinase
MSMALYGYARMSTSEQDFTLQEQTLRAAGCQVIRAEKVSATRRDGRTELALLLEFLRQGDMLVVTRIDRLARSIKDLQDIVHLLKERGVTLRATEQPINTQSATGKAFLDMLGVFAEFETNLRRERHLEGIAAAKARGVYRGRKPSIDPTEIHRLRVEEKLGATAMARRLGIGRASVYRALANRGSECSLRCTEFGPGGGAGCSACRPKMPLIAVPARFDCSPLQLGVHDPPQP